MTTSTLSLGRESNRARCRSALRQTDAVFVQLSRSCAVLVDSNPTFAGSVRNAAERRGIALVHARDVLEGLDVLGGSQFRADPPSHIIFDLDLPDGHGERVLEAAEHGFPRATVIALSEKLDASRACALLGRCSYL